MEEARVEYLRSLEIDFSAWVDHGVDLPVVDLSLQYRQPLMLGMEAAVKCWLMPRRGIRIVWQYDIQNHATQTTCAVGQTTLAPVSRQHRKVLRQLPEPVKSEMARLYSSI
jgi:acyl-CoA thioester hydrolase